MQRQEAYMQKETIPELVFGDEHSLLSPVPKNM